MNNCEDCLEIEKFKKNKKFNKHSKTKLLIKQNSNYIKLKFSKNPQNHLVIIQEAHKKEILRGRKKNKFVN